MGNLRVGIVTDSIEHGAISLRIYTRNLIENLLKLRFKGIEFFLLATRKLLAPSTKKIRSQFLPFPTKKKLLKLFPLKFLSFVKKEYNNLSHTRKLLHYICLTNNIDVLHIPHLGRTSPPFVSLPKKTKLVITNHGMANLALPPTQCYGKRLSSMRLFDYLEFMKWRYFFRNSFDLMITVSESEKFNICRKLFILEEKVRVIYHGVSDIFKPLNNLEHAKDRLRERYGIKFPFIFHVSNYQPKKNIEGLLRAFALAKKKYRINHKLVIGGKQPYHLRRLGKELKIDDALLFTGFIPDSDLALFYNAADLFIFPSFHEGFGMPILEAMACGCPVITSNIFSMPEVAGKAALLVNPYNTSEIADAIQKILTNEKLREELKERGLERAKQFSWEKSAKKHVEVYRMVAEEKQEISWIT